MFVLPPKLIDLYLADNDFSGISNFDNFPKSMAAIDLSNNDFSGPIDFTTLPQNLKTFLFNNNNDDLLKLNLAAFPQNLEFLEL